MLNNAFRELRAILHAMELDTNNLHNDYQKAIMENDALLAELQQLRQEVQALRSEL